MIIRQSDKGSISEQRCSDKSNIKSNINNDISRIGVLGKDMKDKGRE